MRCSDLIVSNDMSHMKRMTKYLRQTKSSKQKGVKQSLKMSCKPQKWPRSKISLESTAKSNNKTLHSVFLVMVAHQ